MEKHEEIVSRAIQIELETVFLLTMIVLTLKTKWLGKTKFYKLHLYHLYFDNIFHKFIDDHIVEMPKH